MQTASVLTPVEAEMRAPPRPGQRVRQASRRGAAAASPMGRQRQTAHSFRMARPRKSCRGGSSEHKLSSQCRSPHELWPGNVAPPPRTRDPGIYQGAAAHTLRHNTTHRLGAERQHCMQPLCSGARV